MSILKYIKEISKSFLYCTILGKGMEKEKNQKNKYSNTDIFSEGKAKIYTKYTEKNSKEQLVEHQVFYNPVQIFNRDLTVFVMQAYINQLKAKKGEKFEGVNIVDALSASGLRTIRFLKEINGIKKVYANDILEASHRLMKDNFQLNNLDPKKYKMTLEDANMLFINSKREKRFDIIDLDPYGSVVPFLENAVGSIAEGGLLCITCTDTRVLCGPDLSKCFYFYGTTRAKVHDFNQNALRVLLYTVSSAASRHCKYITPLLSLQTDFYVRIFVKVNSGRKECAESGSKIGNIFNCQVCGNYQYKPFFVEKTEKFKPIREMCSGVKCSICDYPYFINGPVWLGRINDQNFVKDMMEEMQKKDFSLQLNTHKKIYGTLHAILNEYKKLPDSPPLGFNFDLMAKAIRTSGLSKQKFISAIKSLGEEYQLTGSYITPGIYKSNLPLKGIYDILKSWKLREMGEDKYLNNLTDQHKIALLKKETQYKPDFNYKWNEKEEKVSKFIKMGKGMGPKGKAAIKIIEDNEEQAQLKLKQSQSKEKK